MPDIPVITYALIGITVLISLQAFYNHTMKGQLLFYPFVMVRHKEWHRLISSGFIHANFMHLAVNMYVLYSFGRITEAYFKAYFGVMGPILFLIMYVLAIPMASLYDLLKHKDHSYYTALGASGAVSAVLFSAILFAPSMKIGFLFLPPQLAQNAVVMGVLYLVYSHVMAKKQIDNIGHDAHFFGALFGFIFPILLKPQLFILFIHQLKSIFG